MMFACVFAAYLLRNGWTDLAKLFLLAPSWSQDGFSPKKSEYRIRKSRNTQILGCFLSNLVENFRYYSP